MAKESKSQPSQALTYPRSVYQKDYDHLKGDSRPEGHDAYLKKHSRVVKTEEEHKRLGPDWSPGHHPHFASVKPAEVVKDDEPYEVSDPVAEEKPKSKWGKS